MEPDDDDDDDEEDMDMGEVDEMERCRGFGRPPLFPTLNTRERYDNDDDEDKGDDDDGDDDDDGTSLLSSSSSPPLPWGTSGRLGDEDWW